MQHHNELAKVYFWESHSELIYGSVEFFVGWVSLALLVILVFLMIVVLRKLLDHFAVICLFVGFGGIAAE